MSEEFEGVMFVLFVFVRCMIMKSSPFQQA